MLYLRAACFDQLGQRAVSDVSLTVGPGELVLVTGEAGAGKTTLLRGCLGFMAPLSGEVSLFGRAPAALAHDDLMQLRSRCALSSPSAPLLSNHSLRDNIALPLVMRAVARLDDLVDDVVRRFELTHVCALRPEQVLPRDRDLALAARALVVPAELYVLDEPLLPPAARALVFERLRAGAGALVAVRYAGHFPEAARSVNL